MEMQHQQEVVGIVTKVKLDKIVVEFDRSTQYVPYGEVGFTLRKKKDFATPRKLQDALRCLLSDPTVALDFIRIRFGTNEVQEVSMARCSTLSNIRCLTFNNLYLTMLQKQAVAFAIHNNMAIVHGPPGTGKTATLVEIIYQLARGGNKILVCAPSNSALDNIVDKLSNFGISMVRLGQAAKTNVNVKRYTMSAVLKNMPSSGVISDVREELLALATQHKEATGIINKRRFTRLRELYRELAIRESNARTEILSNTQLVCCTLTSADDKGVMQNLPKCCFDAVIIDECSQALEPQSWIPIPWAKKWIMAGDHHQLAPLVLNEEARRNGLHISLMEKLVEKYGDKLCVTLQVQFRMNAKIMRWISTEFYDGNLVADATVADHLLSDLPGVDYTDETSSCLVFVDTSGCKMLDHRGPTMSYGNFGEAELTAIMVKKLLEAGVSPHDIAVITPYKHQISLLHATRNFKLPPEVEIQTVDSFQGREKEAILLCCVRSNNSHETGFVADPSRTNVAVSRARRLLCVVGDSSTLVEENLIGRLIRHIKVEGVVRSGFDLINEHCHPRKKKPVNCCRAKRNSSEVP